MVVKGGYGVYYDSLNATAILPNQLGFSTITTVPSSNDFGQTWASGNPRAGSTPRRYVSVRRRDTVRHAGRFILGGLCRRPGAELWNLDREHARLQRWRAGAQKELGRTWRRGGVCRNLLRQRDLAFSATEHAGIGADILPSMLEPHRYANAALQPAATRTCRTRSIGLTALARQSGALQPARRQALFASPTIQKNRLLRPFPHMSVGEQRFRPRRCRLAVRTHAVEVSFQRRFSQGLVEPAGYRAEEWLNVINELTWRPQ
jgi:hypothetical protein